MVHLYPLSPMLVRDQSTNPEATVYCHKTNGYGHHPAFLVWGASSHERLPETVKPFTVGYHRILLIGGHRVKPSPLTLIAYPPTGMVLHVASLDRVHPHNG